MKKKKLRLKKSVKLILLGIIILIVLIFGLIKKHKINVYHNTYEYKLLEKGYDNNDITLILDNFNNKEIDKYFLKDKNDIILKLVKTTHYKKDNLSRYLDYIENNNTLSLSDVITLVNVNRDKTYYEDTTPTDTSKEELMLVNKYYYLTEDYTPLDLTKVSSKYAYGENYLAKKALEAFIKMADNAKENDITLVISYGYRSYKDQETIFNNYLKKYDEKKAYTNAAKAGFSDHQTGYGMDISDYNKKSDQDYTETEGYKYLIENAYLYGFIQRYPEDKENITGFKAESYHFRYVGTDAAKIIHDNNLTFEEYYAYYIEK